MLKIITVVLFLTASCFAIQPCPPGTPPAVISETFSSTATVKLERGNSVSRGTAVWNRSLMNLAYHVRYRFDDGASAEYWGLFEEGKRVRYTLQTWYCYLYICTDP